MVEKEPLQSPDQPGINDIMARPSALPVNQERAALLKNIPEEIRALPYFYPNFGDSKSATTFVERYSKGPGHFILRLSSKGDDFLSLSVSIANQSVRHINVVIERRPKLKYFIVEQVKFYTFKELRMYYKEHRICNLEKIENVKLIRPIEKSFDDKEHYDEMHPSDPVQIPKTPSSQQLTAQWSESFSLPQNGNGLQYPPGSTPEVPGAAIRRSSNSAGVRRSSSGARPLPETPDKTQPYGASHSIRPPCPPPPMEGESEYYSRVRDEEKNRIEELRQILRDSEICDCGVALCDSELPQGWTLHKSHDPKSYGCLFYQSSKGETTWNLPVDIVPLITPRQKSIIVKLSSQSGKQPPQVLMAYQDVQDSLTERRPPGGTSAVRGARNS